MEGLQQLYYLHGIGYDYTKYDGEYVVFDDVTRKRALACCGIDTNNESHINSLNFELDVAPWMQMLDEVTLANAHDGKFVIKVPESYRHGVVNFKVPECDINLKINLAHCTEVGNYQYSNERYIALEVTLGALPIGYFKMEVSCEFGTFCSELWSTPKQCYNPYSKSGATKSLGVSLQLYTLKSNRNYGFGDFSDLKTLIRYFADLGGDFVLLNPLHMLFPDQPEKASPYSPSHRCLINPLYIALDDLEDIVGTACWKRFVTESSLEQGIELNDEYLDYATVSHTKYQLYDILYKIWGLELTNNDRFQSFVATQESELGDIPLSSFEWFLQWLACSQLEACQRFAKDMGMQIGLVNDLAVGCTQEGLEYQTYQPCFTEGANVGAPPDPWAENGQNWGLPAPNPLKLKENQFRYFKSLVRANMRSVGALRIDHVMALRRLWWCFSELGKELGCYVYYPFEQLLAILKIESHLNGCVVIGEDLGVVPPEVTSALDESAIFGNTLFYFEKNHDGGFKPANQLRARALTMVANHDVPPFHGWWLGKDIDIKVAYRIIQPEQSEQLMRERGLEKQRLLDWLCQHGIEFGEIESSGGDIYQAVMKVLAASPSQLVAIQLDDLDLQQIPVNIPGTDTEYPNWRRKLNHELAEIFAQQRDFIELLNAIRKK
ncbi:4-alpha-glucanotransferase [Pseudoalteromonas luteoviolacea]|uniref:4-alpha-glucanotransferase n=1 Tax=Pseudoalteromonas luteoviolacea TaxID=43657 RepID=UPI001B363254|nr:4-alpha-glucanotransferase [Pseudoalteromonas luteoviolacea]MBQ4810677.1 4-alpha-glucanotransferase [Pseudoalteromonas luteoviolacea]